jgi:PAT family acetyl-CoA transporter-like MFS transporter 1
MPGNESTISRRKSTQQLGVTSSEEGGMLRSTQLAFEKPATEISGLSREDKRAMVLLVALYLLQGIPVGLAFGSIPYLLRARLSYSQIGVFSLASYPYSLKLLWSPVVDSWYRRKWGRRKSWIVPIQYTVGLMLYWLSRNISVLMDKEVPDVHQLTFLFFTLVFFAATQGEPGPSDLANLTSSIDIAVDGWALTLLSQENLSYASTAQTIGLNSGYFLSFTVFLAFNSVEFSNKYFRPASYHSDIPLVTLPGYLRFAAMAYFAVTTYLAFGQKADMTVTTKEQEQEQEMGIKKVYRVMYSICQLKRAFVLGRRRP